MSTFPIAIDATRLFFRFFLIPNVTRDLTDARTVRTFQLAPGVYNYLFQSGVLADFTFTVTPRGTVDYDHSCDAFLSGRGTTTLQLSGLEVTLDALSLTGADNGGGVLLASVGSTDEDWIQRRTDRLLPQALYFVQQGGEVAGPGFTFALQRDGRFSYASELDTARGGSLAGAGTTTLTFKGHTVLVDATAVSRFLWIQSIFGAKPAQDGKATIVVLPGIIFDIHLDRGLTNLGFSVGTTGTVTLDPGMTDLLEVVVARPPIVRVLPHAEDRQMAWDLKGNAGTNPTTDFLGTTDDRPVIIKTNNNEAVRIDQGNITALGNVNAGKTVNAHDVSAGNIAAFSIQASSEINVGLIVHGIPLTKGNISALGDIAAFSIQARSDISALDNVNAGKTVNAHDVSAKGNISALGNVNAGNMNVTGDIVLTNADCAEDFDIANTEVFEPGTVMVLGEAGALHQSQRAYDKRVAGVISGGGDFKPAIVLDKQESGSNRQPVALLGKVFCKVDAQYGAIEVGDLLTTSPTPGHAMKATDQQKAFGAVIGKSLRPLNEGQGLVPILIALQ